MTFPSKETLIENIAIDFCNNDAGICNLKANKKLGKDICTKDNCYPVKYAEICLQALIGDLPKPIDGYQNLHDEYYRKLMSMKD